jgi:hypothetical protein
MNNGPDIAEQVISKLVDIVKDAEQTIKNMGMESGDPKVMMLGLEGVLKIGAGIKEVKNILNEGRAQAAKEALEQLRRNPNLTDEQKDQLEAVIAHLADPDDESELDEQEQRAVERFKEIMNRDNKEQQDGPDKD